MRSIKTNNLQPTPNLIPQKSEIDHQSPNNPKKERSAFSKAYESTTLNAIPNFFNSIPLQKRNIPRAYLLPTPSDLGICSVNNDCTPPATKPSSSKNIRKKYALRTPSDLGICSVNNDCTPPAEKFSSLKNISKKYVLPTPNDLAASVQRKNITPVQKTFSLPYPWEPAFRNPYLLSTKKP